MPDVNSQSAATLVCVLAAAIYILLRLRQFVCGTGVGGCGDCPKSTSANASKNGEHLITEDQITVTIHDDI
jgi:hypothetical protein